MTRILTGTLTKLAGLFSAILAGSLLVLALWALAGGLVVLAAALFVAIVLAALFGKVEFAVERGTHAGRPEA